MILRNTSGGFKMRPDKQILAFQIRSALSVSDQREHYAASTVIF